MEQAAIVGLREPLRTDELPPQEIIFGSSPRMEEIRQNLERGANADIPWLLQGDTGTGKEILAKFLHRHSRWNQGPFVKVNCPGIPNSLLESELFGYEKGAFTGASDTKQGRIELAHGGTLFLDEIGDLDLGLQSKLLQVLQDGYFYRLGGQRDRVVQTRIVCATNRQLRAEAKLGTFRQDLFYRINVVSVDLPRLQERDGDIPMLIAYFLRRYSEKYGREVPPLSNSLLKRLQAYRWPGNIRELENLIRRYVILGSEQAIAKELLGESQDIVSTEVPSDGIIRLKEVTQKAVQELEYKIILKVLDANGWHRRTAARALNISYNALLYKMQEAGLATKRSKNLS